MPENLKPNLRPGSQLHPPNHGKVNRKVSSVHVHGNITMYMYNPSFILNVYMYICTYTECKMVISLNFVLIFFYQRYNPPVIFKAQSSRG